jgi:hypothetical protein
MRELGGSGSNIAIPSSSFTPGNQTKTEIIYIPTKQKVKKSVFSHVCVFHIPFVGELLAIFTTFCLGCRFFLATFS